MVTDKCPNGPIGLSGPNPNGLSGPIGPNRHSRPCTLLSTTLFVVKMANRTDQPSASAVLRA